MELDIKEFELQKMVEEAGLVSSGPPMLAVYDNPTSTLPFMRRNEILIPLEGPNPKED